MALTFGPATSQYDGRANNGDPTDGGPGQYSAAAPGSCSDGAAFANSGISSGAFGGIHVLSGTADAITGQNANQLASANSFNKVHSLWPAPKPSHRRCWSISDGAAPRSISA